MTLPGDAVARHSRLIPSLDRIESSYLILGSLIALLVLAGVLVRVGLVGLVLGVVGAVVRRSVRRGFRLWERLFSGLTWPRFLAVSLGLIVVGWLAAGWGPGLTAACGLAALVMGVTACLAYMFIDVERYEVERGYKAVHNPVKGQALAAYLVQYGHRVGVPLLAAAAVAAIGGFALLNQGLYETVGRGWYAVGDEKDAPTYIDFLAYALINLYRIVDLLDLADSHHAAEVQLRPADAVAGGHAAGGVQDVLHRGPPAADLRVGPPGAGCWPRRSPTSGARTSRSTSGRGTRCRSHGVGVVGPLLVSLRSVETLTREQRDQLPPCRSRRSGRRPSRSWSATCRPERARPGGRRRGPRPAPGPRRAAGAGAAGATTRATWCGRVSSRRWARSDGPRAATAGGRDPAGPACRAGG